MPAKITIDPARLLAPQNALEAAWFAFCATWSPFPAKVLTRRSIVQRIKQEMERVGFDEIALMPWERVGRIGSGKRVIMMDAHIDTVGIGDPKE